MTDRIDVMISSTARDLPEHRQAAEVACTGLGLFPVMMEDLPALDADAIDASLKMVDDSTVYLGIFAQRYGYVPDDPKNPDRISITELEYRRAVELGKPRLIFVADENHDPSLERETGSNVARLAAFRKRVLTDRVVKFFDSPARLQAHITQALVHWLKLRLTWMPEPPPEPDFLPEPATLPPGSRTLVGRNPNFVGREDTLVALAQDLLQGAEGGASAVITPATAATGAGGIGKTQVALEFAHRYGRYFNSVHWISLLVPQGADLDAHLHAEIAGCGRAMNLPDFPAEQPEQVRVTLQAWRDTPPRLVILDNAESPGQVQTVLPQIAGTRVLVTSRWGEGDEWRDVGVQPCALETLPRDRSIALLRKLAPDLEREPNTNLDALADRLGDYPLALDLAGRYLRAMRRAGLTVAQYRAQLDDSALKHASLTDWAARANQTSPTQHDTDVAATFGLSWAKVDDPLADRLFRACGYLAPTVPIPRKLLRQLAADAESGATDAETLATALQQLVQYGLLTPDTDDDTLLAIHPLLADFASGLDADRDASAQQLARVVDALARLAEEANGTGLPANFVSLRAHVEVVAPRAEAAEIKDATELWNELGSHLGKVADFPAARQHFEHALAIDERVYGPDHPHIAKRLNNLGNLLLAIGDLDAARQHLERALAIAERALGSSHSDVAMHLNNLGTVLQNLGDLDAARRHLERALAIGEQVHGSEHPDVALWLNNLGTIAYQMSDVEAARQYLERALAIGERVHGPDHPDVARTLNNLGYMLRELGDLDTARQYLERVLDILGKTLPAEHPYVGSTLNNLGRVVRDLGDPDTARQYFERALHIFATKLPADHPHIQSVRDNLDSVDI